MKMILRMMKKSSVILALICAMMVMMLATGCGKEKETPIPIDLSQESGQVKAQAEDSGQPQEDDLQAGQAAGNEELEGSVRNVGQDSFVISKIETFSDGDASFAVEKAPGTEEADDLVTVYVNQGCTYRYKTVRNGGINPEDISEREGSYGDLQEGMTCNLTGSWREGSFYADSIVMFEFV